MVNPLTHTDIPVAVDPYTRRRLPTNGIAHYHCWQCRRAVRDGESCHRCEGEGWVAHTHLDQRLGVRWDTRVPITRYVTLARWADIELGDRVGVGTLGEDGAVYEVIGRRLLIEREAMELTLVQLTAEELSALVAELGPGGMVARVEDLETIAQVDPESLPEGGGGRGTPPKL